MNKPADCLLDAELDDGWVVTERLERGTDATGGFHSTCYIVQRGDERAFLKALDFTMWPALGLPFADAMSHLGAAYAFERDLIRHCSDRRMANVVRGLGAGEISVDPGLVDPRWAFLCDSVPYIVFEVAQGDVRSVVAQRDEAFDAAWSFRVLHGVAKGLGQLHSAEIEHQDLKPSNVMKFRYESKVGDLGRASNRGSGPFNSAAIVGDVNYAPPELLYGERHTDDRFRRRSVDAYHLGSLAVFLFSGAGLTAMLVAEMDEEFHWRTWPRDYRSALPYVRDAFDRVVESVLDRVPARSRATYAKLVRELADPDPLLRGNPARGSSAARFSMDRYVSLLDRLARSAESELRTSGAL